MAERLTIIDFVEKYVAKFSKNPFLWEKNLDTNVWEPTTYEETLAKAKRIAAGLMALGVQKGEKISQMVIVPILTPELEQVDSLEETERGDGGFGSTGKF